MLAVTEHKPYNGLDCRMSRCSLSPKNAMQSRMNSCLSFLNTMQNCHFVPYALRHHLNKLILSHSSISLLHATSPLTAARLCSGRGIMHCLHLLRVATSEIAKMSLRTERAPSGVYLQPLLHVTTTPPCRSRNHSCQRLSHSLIAMLAVQPKTPPPKAGECS